MLNNSFTEEEGRHAILNLATGKAAGEDTIPSEFYKVYLDCILPIYMDILSSIYTGVESPPPGNRTLI